MQCTSPVLVSKKIPRVGKVSGKELDDLLMFVPCGRCRACRKARTREWAARMYHEGQFHERKGFLTLTYADEHLPWKESLNKHDWQNFMKRLRKEYPSKLSYFMCGEYGGTKTKRPHYHAVMYGLDKRDLKLVKEVWGKGRVHIGTVTPQSCNYVAGYVQKKLGGEYAKHEYGVRHPPFALMSQGLGLRWAKSNESYIKVNQNITIHGKSVGVPRYYVKKLGLELDVRRDESNDATREVFEALLEKYKGRPPWDLLKKIRAQRALNLEAKDAMRPADKN